MLISVINHTAGLLPDADVQVTIRAINRQIAEDFAPVWDMTATLRLEGGSGTAGYRGPSPEEPNLLDMRGDAIIYLWHPRDPGRALAYHAKNFLGVPFGFVFPEVSHVIGEHWTVSLSHEALEILADPEVNLMVIGPHPQDANRPALHWYEVCDAVQRETYFIDGIRVSNFVLPLYFTNGEETGGRNDFLGNVYNGQTLRSFGLNPGGYQGYLDPTNGFNGLFVPPGDGIALRRSEVKNSLGLARRSQRYQYRAGSAAPITQALKPYRQLG